MTKFDHRFQLPQTLADRNLSLLSISRGSYLLADIQTFEKFTENPQLEITDFTIPSYIESLDFSIITSEALAINCAYVSHILQNFTQDKNLLPTVNGRMGSQSFGFNIRRVNGSNLHVDVQNAQIEIDGGYEGDSLYLIEAKNNIFSDFSIRQLYYPYRLWQSKIAKPVRPIFLTYTNGIFHFREYQFSDLYDYNSISLIKEKKYRLKSFSESVLNMETLQEILHRIQLVTDSNDIPFPQADSFERVINLCEILYNNADEEYTKEILVNNYDFTEKESFEKRQVDYYTNAAIYLGLIKKVKTFGKIVFKLTDKGLSLFQTTSIIERQIQFIKAILEHEVFHKALTLYLKKEEAPTKNEIVVIMKQSNICNVRKDNTYERRASTVLSWINWILEAVGNSSL